MKDTKLFFDLVALFDVTAKFYEDYLIIHEEMFKPSIRKIMPLHPKFEKIDFKKCNEKLSNISAELERVRYKMKHIIRKSKKNISAIEGFDKFVEYLEDYFRDLWMVICSLKSLAERYEEESEGFRKFPVKEQKRLFNYYIKQVEIFNATREIVLLYLMEFSKYLTKDE